MHLECDDYKKSSDFGARKRTRLRTMLDLPLLCVAGEATSPTTLAESAALQQAKHSHVELKEVEVVTGEEDESNVFQVTSLLTQHS